MLHPRKKHQNFRILVLLMLGLGILTIQASCLHTDNGLSLEESETDLSQLSRTKYNNGEHHLGAYLEKPEKETQKFISKSKEIWRPCQKWLEISKGEVVCNEGKVFFRAYFRSNQAQNLDTMKIKTSFYPDGLNNFSRGADGKEIINTHTISGYVKQGEVFSRDFLLDEITQKAWDEYYKKRENIKKDLPNEDYIKRLKSYEMDFKIRISVPLEVAQQQISVYEGFKNNFTDPSILAVNAKALSERENADLVFERNFLIVKGGESQEEKDAHAHDYSNDSFFDSCGHSTNSKNTRSGKYSWPGSTLFRSKKRGRKGAPKTSSNSRSRRSSVSSVTNSFLSTFSRRNKNK